MDSAPEVKNGEWKKIVKLDDVKAALTRSHVSYDRKGDEHYHCASALQKSIRGSDANAALYWTMRMFAGGEDPMFIARRLVRTAAEDVGLGDPQVGNKTEMDFTPSNRPEVTKREGLRRHLWNLRSTRLCRMNRSHRRAIHSR